MTESGTLANSQCEQKSCSSNPTDNRVMESDSDTEIDAVTYERKREECMRKIILLEKAFVTTKKRLYDEKMKQLEARQAELLNQTAPDFLAKKAVLVAEYRARTLYNKAVRDLRVESLKRKSVGNFHNMEADTMRTHDLIREKLEDEICAEINNLRNVKNLTGAPVVVYMARKDEIMSDLNLANEAIFLADLEKIRESQADSLRLLENKSMRLMMPDF
ncbi:unnamed protein product [Enterobius vermicularis]|uniref:DUF4201 domain-containing protein n=1 Tax=Enterobius vermicularis TaxID=51028 RepID=A0A0N4VIV5_ENTVE|nr:unnamed protein product [Enterobius vermicularis]